MAVREETRVAKMGEIGAETRSALSGRRFLRYLGWVLLVPVVCYAVMFPLVIFPSLGFDRWGGSKWAPVLDYAYDADQQDADLVIFGDSSAFLGISPQVIDSEVGLRSIVLPNTVGSLVVTGDLALRHYLAHNRPPRFLVFYFAPWDLDYEHFDRPEFFFEGEEMLLRHGSPGEIAGFAARHPVTLLAFPLQLNSLLGVHDFRLAMQTDRGAATALGRGHMGYTDSSVAVNAACTIPAKYVRRQAMTAIQALVQRYANAQTRVAVYLAPIPSCANAGVVLGEDFSQLRASPPHTLPPDWFAADGVYVHLFPEHVVAASKIFAEALRGWGFVGDGSTAAPERRHGGDSGPTAHAGTR